MVIICIIIIIIIITIIIIIIIIIIMPPGCPRPVPASRLLWIMWYSEGGLIRDDTVGNPHRAQISQSELFENILLLKLCQQLPVEQFEAAVLQSTLPPS